MALGVGGGRPEISLPRSFLKVGAYACKQDSVFFVADLCEIHLVIYLFVAMSTASKSEEQNKPANCVDRNLGRHHAVYLQQHGFLICYLKETVAFHFRLIRICQFNCSSTDVVLAQCHCRIRTTKISLILY